MSTTETGCPNEALSTYDVSLQLFEVDALATEGGKQQTAPVTPRRSKNAREMFTYGVPAIRTLTESISNLNVVKRTRIEKTNVQI